MTMMRILCASFLATLTNHAAATNAADAPPPRPNLIVFLMDDVGYADIGPFGAEGIATPHFDRVAAEGVKLTDFYVHPVCGVTRAALLTGCYAMRVAEHHNIKHGHPILHSDEITLAEVLKKAGYATALIGKWHLAGDYPADGPAPFDPAKLPNGQGFDYWFGTPTHNGTTRTIEGSRFRTWLMRNGEVLDQSVDQDEMDHLVQRYTAEAIAWIKQHKDEPFFLYVAHNQAHVVLGAREEFRGSSQRGLYGDVMQELDWSAGQIMAALRGLGLAEKTLVIATSDNGPWNEQHLAGPAVQKMLDDKYGKMSQFEFNEAYRQELQTSAAFRAATRDDHFGRATPLRGTKMQTWEGGLRVPALAWWPGQIPAGKTCQQPATIMDLMPTFAKLAGTTPPADRLIDGRDIMPLLTDPEHAASPHQAIYYYAFTHLQAVRRGKWKLVAARPARPAWGIWYSRYADAVPAPQLYDIEADIGESRDVAAEHPEVVARLQALLEKGRNDIGDYDRIGAGQRFFDPEEQFPKRAELRKWIDKK